MGPRSSRLLWFLVYDLSGIAFLLALEELSKWPLWDPVTWGAMFAVFTLLGEVTYELTRG